MSTNKKSRFLSFDAQTAVTYGIDEAIMIHNFIFWIEKNIANGKNYYDGRTWTYNTQEAFTFLFPFWSRRQVQRILESLEKQLVLIKGNYNLTAYDRTQWYAFQDESKWLNLPSDAPLTLEDVQSTKPFNGKPQTVQSKAPNRSIESPKPFNRKPQTVQPIPDNNQTAKTDNNHSTQPPVISVTPFDENLLLSLVGLNEKQNLEASQKLARLSPIQRDLAIQTFNKTVSSGGVKSSPMALMNRLIDLGSQNALEQLKPIQAVQTIATSKTAEKTRLEVISSHVLKFKSEFLKEFEQKRAVYVRGVGNVFKDDLVLAGLFD